MQTDYQFKMRTTKPEAGNKYYITVDNGGYSKACKGNSKYRDPDCDVLPNCVGYAYGRFNEIGGYGYCKYLTPSNAEKFIQYKNASLVTGQAPKVGACMVWQKGATLDGSDGAGHVAIVEKVISEDEVYTSESGWSATKPFWNQTRKKGSGNWGQNSTYKFLGFIYNPAVPDNINSTPQKPDSSTDNVVSLDFKVNDIVQFNGSTQYTSAYAVKGIAASKSMAKITSIHVGGQHPYHCRAVDKSGKFIGGVYGWVNADDVCAIVNTAPVTPPATPPATPAVKPPVTPNNQPGVKVGDVVSIVPNAEYATGKVVPSWVIAKKWIVSAVSNNTCVTINKSTDGKNAINSPIDVKYLTVIEGGAQWTPSVGDIVTYNGNVHYTNANAATGSPCKGGKAKITNIYQLGKSKHPYHLVRVSGKGASVYGWVDEGTFTKA